LQCGQGYIGAVDHQCHPTLRLADRRHGCYRDAGLSEANGSGGGDHDQQRHALLHLPSARARRTSSRIGSVSAARRLQAIAVLAADRHEVAFAGDATGTGSGMGRRTSL
jgi:hypothetical protein